MTLLFCIAPGAAAACDAGSVPNDCATTCLRRCSQTRRTQATMKAVKAAPVHAQNPTTRWGQGAGYRPLPNLMDIMVSRHVIC